MSDDALAQQADRAGVPEPVPLPGEYVGQVKVLQPEKSFGFIHCPALKGQFQNDVFVLRENFRHAGITVGSDVRFRVFVNHTGKPQARDVILADPAAAAADPSSVLGLAPGDKVLGQATGTIKMFNSDKKYGFIECPNLKAQGYPKDVFVGYSHAMGFCVGSVVSFTLVQNKKGDPEAKALTAVDPTLAAAMAPTTLLPPVDTTLLSQAQGVKRKHDEMSGDGSVFNGVFKGVIRTFSEQNGYGFVECEQMKAMGFSSDAFLHSSQAQGFAVGASVMFDLYVNKQGKPNAKNLQWAEDNSMVATSGTLCVRYAGSTQTPSDNLYISGIPGSVKQEEIVELFQSIGLNVVRTKIMPDKVRLGVNVAMVQTASQPEAAKAIEQFNGLVVEGQAQQQTPPAPPGVPMPPLAGLGVQVLPPGMAVPPPAPGLPAVPAVPAVPGLPAVPTVPAIPALPPVATLPGLSVPAIPSMPAVPPVVPPVVPEVAGAVPAVPLPIVAAVPASAPAAPGITKMGALTVRFAGAEQTPSPKLHITGLPPATDAETVREMFTDQEFTVKDCEVIAGEGGLMDALVEVSSVDEAVKAITAFHGQLVEIEGDAEEGEGGRSPDKSVLKVSYTGGSLSENIYVAGIPAAVDQIRLENMFKKAGFKVKWSKVTKDASGTQTAIFELGSVEEAALAIVALDGKTVAVTGMMDAPGEQAVADDLKAKAAAESGEGATVLHVQYAGKEKTPSDTIYLQGLPANTDLALLNDMFKENGFAFKRSKVTPDDKGYGTNHAMVQLVSDLAAAAAIAAFHGQTVFNEGPIEEEEGGAVASNAVPGGMPSTGAADNSLAASFAGWSRALTVKYLGKDEAPGPSLYMNGLPPNINREIIRKMFAVAGFGVKRVKVQPDNSGFGCVTAFCELENTEDGAKAIAQFNNQVIDFASLAGPDTVATPAPAAAPSAPGVMGASHVPAAPPAPGGGGWKGAGKGKRPPDPIEAAGALRVQYSGVDHSPSDNLYVSGIPTTLSQPALEEVFRKAGCTVMRSKVMPDRFGAGRVSGMVQVANKEEAARAIEHLNGYVIPPELMNTDGPDNSNNNNNNNSNNNSNKGQRPLSVNYAGRSETPTSNLFIAGLPGEVDQPAVHAMFTQAGFTVERCKVLADSKGFGCVAAMVQLANIDQAQRAKAMFHGKVLTMAA
eukprot:TRINITY_DN13424_c0_g3_i2.p1 TRINITY_DN13424_c0_g3~~TRINITY_DN13424_c0_g3_i2.p1  ORF type:complete len:1177 (+),score=287.72 TRINITY_DN13424_c0_g3_i2:100-3630(+)